MLTLDSMGKRYGKFPSECLEKDLLDWSINFWALRHGVQRDDENAKKKTRRR